MPYALAGAMVAVLGLGIWLMSDYIRYQKREIYILKRNIEYLGGPRGRRV